MTREVMEGKINKDTKEAGLLSQLQRFNKSSLKHTETSVTTEDGKKLLETHDKSGNFKASVGEGKGYGFIPDTSLDLQVGEILPGLILASQDVAAESDILEKYGVTHVLNVATYVKNYFEGRIKYINMRINDYTDVAILPCFPNAFKFIDEGRAAGCVLVHCNAGVSRAATICIGYVMRTEGMSFQDAFKHVKSKRPKIDPNAGFIHQLERVYTQTLKEENVEVKRK